MPIARWSAAETTRCSPADRGDLDDDLVARDAVREEAGRDRQLIAAEGVATRRRTRLFAPSAPTRKPRGEAPAVVSMREAVAHDRYIGGPRTHDARARRAAPRRTARGRTPRGSRRPAQPSSRDIARSGRSRVGRESRRADRAPEEHRYRSRRDQRERTPGDTAAARLFARMRRIEERDRAPRRASTIRRARPPGPAPTMAITSASSLKLQPQAEASPEPQPQRARAVRRALRDTLRAMIDVDAGRFTVGSFRMLRGREGTRRIEAGGVPARIADDHRQGESRSGGAHRDDIRRRRRAARDRGASARVLARGPLVDAAAGRRRATWQSSGSPARCGASDFRRTTAASSRRSPPAAGCWSRFTASRARLTRSRVLHSYGGGNAAIGAWTGRV